MIRLQYYSNSFQFWKSCSNGETKVGHFFQTNKQTNLFRIKPITIVIRLQYYSNLFQFFPILKIVFQQRDKSSPLFSNKQTCSGLNPSLPWPRIAVKAAVRSRRFKNGARSCVFPRVGKKEERGGEGETKFPYKRARRAWRSKKKNNESLLNRFSFFHRLS